MLTDSLCDNYLSIKSITSLLHAHVARIYSILLTRVPKIDHIEKYFNDVHVQYLHLTV